MLAKTNTIKDRTFTRLSTDELKPNKANTTVFSCPPQPHSPAFYTGSLSSEQPNSYFKIPARWLISDTDGGFYQVPDHHSLTSPLGPSAWPRDGGAPSASQTTLRQHSTPPCTRLNAGIVHGLGPRCRHQEASRETGMQSWREGKKASRLQTDWEVASPSSRPRASLPLQLFSSLFATGLRKHKMRKLGPFVHAAMHRGTEHARPSITMLVTTTKRGAHLSVMPGRQEE